MRENSICDIIVFMVSRELRNKILRAYIDKDENVLVGHIIDLVNKADSNNKVEHTQFLDLNELKIAGNILNKLKIRYKVLDVVKDMQRNVIFLLPDYIDEDKADKIYSEHISCIKIIPNVKNKLIHREYMGAIYSLGIDRNFIGDIFNFNDNGYVFTFSNMVSFFENNLISVGREVVRLEILDLYSDEVRSISLNYKSVEVTVSSLRIDSILSYLYNLSRSEIKNKITAGDLYVNSKEMFYVAYVVNTEDIISLKKCGKFKVGNVVRNTRSGKIVLEIFKYI